MRARGWLCRLLGLAGLVGACWAMAADRALESVRFQHYGVAEGLSQATVRALVEDSRGFIWMGTQDGLNRFDGRQFVTYRHQAGVEHSLSDNNIMALAIGSDDSLWVATQSGGLNRHDPRTDRFERFRFGPRLDSLADVSVDSAGRVWVRVESGGLYWFDIDSASLIEPAVQLPAASEQPRFLGEFGDGSTLLASTGQLWRWPGSGDKLEPLLVAEDQTISFLAMVQRDEELWITTESHGLVVIAASGGDVLATFREDGPKDERLLSDELRSLLLDRENSIWVGSSAGLHRFDTDGRLATWVHHPGDRLGLAGNRVVSLLEDRDGLIWAGTWTGGVSVHDPDTAAFVLVRNRPGDPLSLPGNAVPAVYENVDGTLWLSVLDVGGLVLFDPEVGVIEHFRYQPGIEGGLPHHMVGDFLPDEEGGLLVATLGAGLVRLDRDSRRFERLFADPALDIPRSARVEQLYRDRAGTLWVSTIGDGLYSLCRGCDRFTAFRHDPLDPHSLAGDEVNGVLETDQGEFWIALRRHGLSRMDRDSGRFERFRASDDRPGSLRHNSITGMHQSRDGTLWIGTQGGGLHRMDDEYPQPVFTVFDRRTGLAADAIGEIGEDSDGRIWVSTSVGLSRVNPASLRVENFAFIDGHAGAGFFIGSVHRPAPGRLWFGGLDGLVGVLTDQVPTQDFSPEVQLTEVLIGNQPVAPGSKPGFDIGLGWLPELRLGQDRTMITLEFTAPGLRHQKSLRYAYRLIGLDDEWIETGPDRALATFTRLPPADYHFEVRASGDGRQWGPTTHLPLVIKPAAWRSTQALTAYLLVLIALLALAAWRIHRGWQRRLAAQRKIEEQRERLEMALWGSRDELWDADLVNNTLVRQNRMDRVDEDDDIAYMTLEEFWAGVHPKDAPALKKSFVDHVKGRTPYFESEFRARPRQGRWHWMLSRGRITRVDENGTAIRLAGTTRDISELKRTQEKLRRLNEQLESRVAERTRELQQSNDALRQTLDELRLAQKQLVQSEKLAALGGLVAGIAHEVNTPLGVGVTAASHLNAECRRASMALEEGRLDEDDLQRFVNTAARSADLILRNLRRADELVRSFKQVAVDQSSEQRRAFELGGYLDEILLSLHPRLKRTRHEVGVDCDSEIVMNSYPGALYQVIINLVINSLDHAFDENQGGHISISARAEDDRVTLEYIDDGKGMEEQVAARMFDPFFTTRRGAGGSGLGLHIVFNLVTKVLGGTISCETAPGKGVSFSIELPRRVVVDSDQSS